MSLVEAETLKQWSKKRTKRALKQWLGRRGVPWWEDGDGWPITTEAALNQALGVTGEKERPNLDAVRRPHVRTTAEGPR